MADKKAAVKVRLWACFLVGEKASLLTARSVAFSVEHLE